ncbi:MAG: hypothetical protein NTV93_16735 [Verrucomicrobia bacterium]|nr:hypothetical protein [Verrucomicrobiota bacterium]
MWADLGDAPNRNVFVRFERSFALGAIPSGFLIHLFADTRYRLWVNGEFVAYGPGRFVTQHPEFDTHELASRLCVGGNQISVEVNFFGASSYQSMPDGAPGFIAAGGNESVNLETPGDWRATRMTAWRWDAPLFSFAQNPVEICDTRLVECGQAVGIVACAESPWGRLRPYSGLRIPYFEQRPREILLAGKVLDEETIVGFMCHDPLANVREEGAPKPWTAFATWIHSPRKQSVCFSVFWSYLWLNGKPLPVDTGTARGNHAHAQLELEEGWNLLTGHLCVLTEFWTYCLGIPKSSSVTLHGRRDLGCQEPLAISPKAEKEEIALPTLEDDKAPPAWLLCGSDTTYLTPARLMAWDTPAPDARRNLSPEQMTGVRTIHGSTATWCFLFAGEFLGHIVMDVEAPEGCILDVGVDDWQHEGGGLALYRSNPFTDSADRFLLKGGRQRVEVFHPRGGKMIQITLRAPEGVADLVLHDLFVRSSQSLGADETSFTCDDPVLNWVWPTALRTLICSTDDSFSDCPWRERGSYIGDGFVNLHLNALLSADLRIAARTIRIFGQAQRPDGQLACVAPAWLRKPHEDFTLIWLLSLHDYWSGTGDLGLVDEMWPVVGRIWDSPTWECHPSGLWNANDRRLFIDWGVIVEERAGTANAVINLLRIAAACACAEMAEALGLTDKAARFTEDAEATEQAMERLLWNESEGRLDAFLGATTPAAHANTLALAFRFGSEERRERILSYLEPRLRKNLSQGLKCGANSGHLELFYLAFALPALAGHGRPDLAEQLIRDHYGYLESLGDDTLPENFYGADHSAGSRCHSWAGAGAIYAARYVLGVRWAEHGNPHRLVFDPIVDGIDSASGRIAHRDGWIEVSWERIDGEIHSRIHAPAGVEILTPSDRGIRAEEVHATLR